MKIEIHYGYCHCGCGEKTNICTDSNKNKGVIRGEPRKYIIGHQNRNKPQDIWKYVTKTDSCWLWHGCTQDFGYGVMRIKQKTNLTHRLSWELANGRKIPDGLCVLHRCDVPACVNPDHLFLGTKKDNNDDKMSKGRNRFVSRSGEDHPSSKLTVALVKEIRERYEKGRRGWSRKGGITHESLASEYGVGKTIIGAVIKGDRWTSIK